MKRVLFVTVLAAALVFAFSGVAMAKYAGYAYDGGGPDVGYLSWLGATTAADFYTGGTADTTTPHGGYTANTVKCAVCHSVHRAFSAEGDGRDSNTERTEPGVGGHIKLTAGFVCTACHTPSGATPVDKLVEWPSVYTDGGPHARQRCVGACHAGVHGANLSDYAASNRFMLNPAGDAGIAASFAAGNEWTEQDSIDNDPVNRGRGIVTEERFRNFDLPAGTQGATTDRAMRAMSTGYVCAQSGCHTSSQFVVNRWGYGGAVASDPGDVDNLDKIVTGHMTNMVYGCPPCHMNDIAFYPWNFPNLGRESTCALCHDALGLATGSTAWPHANRNITFLETEDGMTWTAKPVGADSRNLWMYAGDATRRDAEGNPVQTGGTLQARKRTLIEDAAAFNLTANVPGNINDGTCLKCHSYIYGNGHNPGGWPTTNRYFKADGEWTGNVLGFANF